MIATFHPKQEPTDGIDAVRLSLCEGAVYRFKGIEGRRDGRPVWVVPPGDYRLIGAGRHAINNQELVAYRCLANGKLFFCTLTDWADKFEAPPPDPAPPEKLAGAVIPGATHAPNPETVNSVEHGR